MAIRNGKENLAVWVDTDIAERFKAAARLRDGGVSQALTRMIAEAVGDVAAVAPKGVGQGPEVKIRLRGQERFELAQAARARGTTPANWVRSLVLVHLMRKPEWSDEDRDALRAIAREIRPIANNINQIARALNAAALLGTCPPSQGEAAERAAELVRYEHRRLASVVTGNFDYWGLPDADRPTAARGAIKRQAAEEKRAADIRKNRLKLRPRRFREAPTSERDE